MSTSSRRHSARRPRACAWFGPDRALPVEPVLARIACAHALFHRLGLRASVIEALAVWARLPVVIAESASVSPGAMRQYPARLPDYQDVDEEGRSA